MKIRRFTGASMRRALDQVKATLGPEAVILDTAEENGQVIVTAALDDDPRPMVVGGDRELVREMRRLLDVVRTLVDDRQRGPGGDLVRLHRALAEQGVDGLIAAALVRETAERCEPGAPLDAACSPKSRN